MMTRPILSFCLAIFLFSASASPLGASEEPFKRVLLQVPISLPFG